MDSARDQAKVKITRRPPLSCVPCRSKKIKCDRIRPTCNRCKRSDKPSQCSYADEPVLKLSGLGGESQRGVDLEAEAYRRQNTGDKSGHLNATRRRRIEVIAEHNSQQPLPSDTLPCLQSGTAKEADKPSLSYLKGTGYSTRFFGPTYVLNIYSQFDGLRNYIREVKHWHPATEGIFYGYPQTARIPREAGLQNVSSNFPDRKTADQLLEIYIQQFEPKCRLFHIPSLRARYLDFWNGQRPDNSGFLAQLLLICATSYVSLNEKSAPRHEGSQFQVKVSKWIQLAEEMWQKQDSVFFRPVDMESLQFLCLLVIACRTNFLFANKIFGWSGQLSNLAISMGYHQEPPAQFALSEFHREMRRRIWIAILEICLSASVDRGITPSFYDRDTKITLPIEIDDCCLDEHMQTMPKVQTPTETFTNMSIALVMHRSFHLRYEVARMVSSGKHYDYLEILKADQGLRQALAEIPEWSSADGKRGKKHVKLAILQSLLSLHYVCAARPDAILGSWVSRKLRLELAMALIAESCGTEDSLPAWIISDDPIFAAMVICHDIQSGENEFASNRLRQVVPGFLDSLYDMVEVVTCGLEDRLRLLQRGVNKIYCLIMMTAFSKSKMWPAEKESHQQEASHRLVSRTYEYVFGKDAVNSYLESYESTSIDIVGEAIKLGSGNFGASEIPSWSGEAWAFDNFFDYWGKSIA